MLLQSWPEASFVKSFVGSDTRSPLLLVRCRKHIPKSARLRQLQREPIITGDKSVSRSGCSPISIACCNVCRDLSDPHCCTSRRAKNATHLPLGR
uniref:Uncharacterized protein n=1 Tax=uncultured marine virus TaxID=186617 RepID=A0A0F7L860_9VIRU|nr:hypothetical protein [uncultured marine virus]